MRSTLCGLLVATALFPACQRAEATQKPAATSELYKYPSDITPPAGTQYPCALTALPKNPAGIPSADRDYINRTYALILRATQAKLLVLKALDEQRNVRWEWQKYDDAIGKYLALLRDDAPPAGLEAFRADVIAAIELQRAFFQQAMRMQQGGRPMNEIFAMPEGRQASQRLISAWGRMQSRYPSWDSATQDSIYHHLCALDLF